MQAIKAKEKRMERESEEFTEIPDREDEIITRFDSTISIPKQKIILDYTIDSLSVDDKILAHNIKLKVVGNQHICIIGSNGIGGYFVYNKYIKNNVGKFQIQYTYEDYMGLGNHGYVAGYKGVSPEDVVISDSFEVDGSKRTTYGIKINAFKDNTNMKSVDIPATVKFISANSFVGCTNLETIISGQPTQTDLLIPVALQQLIKKP